MTLKKNEIVNITVDHLNHSGEAIAFLETSKIVVNGLLPGEGADVKIIKPGKNVNFAKVFEITKASAKRTPSVCQNNSCGACELLCAQYDNQLEIKSSFISEVFGSSVTVEPSEQTHYRNKIILPVRRIEGKLHIGTYRRNSHEVTNWLNDCPVIPETMNRIIAKTRELLKLNDPDGKTAQLFIRGSSEEFQAGLIVTSVDDDIIQTLKDLSESGINITSTFYSTSSGTNSVLVRDPVFVSGTEFAVLKTDNGIYKVSPQSFFQANIFTLNKILKKISEIIGSYAKPRVLDLYSGCGVLSDITGLKRTCIELNPASFMYSKENDASEFITADVPGVVSEIISGGYNIIIADPPRKGIDAKTLEAIDSSFADTFIYLSCEPETQKRDIGNLKNYRVSEINGYDMFPNTIQIESLVILKRK